MKSCTLEPPPFHSGRTTSIVSSILKQVGGCMRKALRGSTNHDRSCAVTSLELLPAFRIIDQGTVVESLPGSIRSSCCFPSLCVMPNGRWIVGLRGAPFKQSSQEQALVSWSDDEGRSWPEPTSPFVAPCFQGRAGRFRSVSFTSLGGKSLLATLPWIDNADPSLPFFNEETQGLLNCRLMLTRSDDAGETWSPPRWVDTLQFSAQPNPGTGPTLVLPDGRWACQFELNKPYFDTSEWRHASCIVFSSDQGKSWHNATRIAHDPANRLFHWDQRLSILRDGTLLDLFWTYDNAAAEYPPIHACESRDGGKTWSTLWNTGVTGQPARPVELLNGELAMVYVDRTVSPQIKVRMSSDGGRTWPPETEETLSQQSVAANTYRKSRMQDAWTEMSAFSLGLPDARALPDGSVLVVYYHGANKDETSIQWCRIKWDYRAV
jgi:hypothetical protein